MALAEGKVFCASDGPDDDDDDGPDDDEDGDDGPDDDEDDDDDVGRWWIFAVHVS